MEVWDGYFIDGTLANIDLIRGEVFPEGLYHMSCEVLVKHKDGDYLLMRRDFSKSNYGGYYEATAGGAALKGENKIECIKRELFEETGIISENFKELDRFIYDESKCIFYTFLCSVDCNKTSIKLQEGETMSYKWVSEKDFIKFVNSAEIINLQNQRYLNYFIENGFLIN